MTTTTRPRWISAERLGSPAIVPERVDGGARPLDRRTVTLPVSAPEPDFSRCPANPWLPWRRLAARAAAGEDVTADVRFYIAEAARGRASSVAQVIGLRLWRREAFEEALARIARDSLALQLEAA